MLIIHNHSVYRNRQVNSETDQVFALLGVMTMLVQCTNVHAFQLTSYQNVAFAYDRNCCCMYRIGSDHSVVDNHSANSVLNGKWLYTMQYALCKMKS